MVIHLPKRGPLFKSIPRTRSAGSFRKTTPFCFPEKSFPEIRRFCTSPKTFRKKSETFPLGGKSSAKNLTEFCFLETGYSRNNFFPHPRKLPELNPKVFHL